MQVKMSDGDEHMFKCTDCDETPSVKGKRDEWKRAFVFGLRTPFRVSNMPGVWLIQSRLLWSQH